VSRKALRQAHPEGSCWALILNFLQLLWW